MDSRDYRRLTLIVGPDGSGKTLLIDELRKSVDFYRIIPVTTRPIRKGEQEGIDYRFITWEKYAELAENDQFLSTFQKGGHHFGVTYEEFDSAMEKNKPVIWIVNLTEALKIKVHYPNIKTVLVIARLDAIRKRLEDKGIKTEELINTKLIEAKIITDQATQLDYIIVFEEDKIVKAADQLKEIVLDGAKI